MVAVASESAPGTKCRIEGLIDPYHVKGEFYHFSWGGGHNKRKCDTVPVG